MIRITHLLIGIVASTLAGAVCANETKLRLADSPDAVLVRAKCSICHSVDYIPMNSRFLNRAGWEAEVRKMIKVMGAPIADDEASRIIGYLVTHYGPEP